MIVNKRRRLVALIILASLVFVRPSIGNAEQSSVGEQQIVSTQLEPYILQSGETFDANGNKGCEITIAEQHRSVCIPVVVQKNGLLRCNVYHTSVVATGAGIEHAVSVGIYTDEKCTTLLGEQKVHTLEQNGNVYHQDIEVVAGAVYYVKIVISEQVYSGTGNYQFHMDLLEECAKATEVTGMGAENGTTEVTAYEDITNKEVYYKLQVEQPGTYFFQCTGLDENTVMPKIDLCDEKKKRISLVATHNEGQNYCGVFAVDPGCYYLHAKDGRGVLKMHYSFLASGESSGKKKSKARKIELGNQVVDGTISLTDKKNSYDWYKFTLKKPSRVKLFLEASTTAKSKLRVEIIPPKRDKKGKRIVFPKDPVFFLSGENVKRTAVSETNWPAGTWYIKINKDVKFGSARYQLDIGTVKKK